MMAESTLFVFRSVLRICSYFNPRTPVGCDMRILLCHAKCRYFNPRTPVGCDTSVSAYAYDASYFNPRTPVGCDLDNRLG